MITLVVGNNNLSPRIVFPCGLIVIDSPSSYEVPLASKIAAAAQQRQLLCAPRAHTPVTAARRGGTAELIAWRCRDAGMGASTFE